MAFPIPPVSSPTFKPVSPSQTRQVENPTTQGAEGGDGFTKAIGDALNNVSQLDNRVAEASAQAATGDLGSVTDYMIASTEAQLATEITVAVRDRAITAFNDIMRMQI
jgi:flagellar hook-basal body complex protein FliE